jgi:hypothetical protein
MTRRLKAAASVRFRTCLEHRRNNPEALFDIISSIVQAGYAREMASDKGKI